MGSYQRKSYALWSYSLAFVLLWLFSSTGGGPWPVGTMGLTSRNTDSDKAENGAEGSDTADLQCPTRWTCQGYNYSRLSDSSRSHVHYRSTNCACDDLCVLLHDCCPDVQLGAPRTWLGSTTTEGGTLRVDPLRDAVLLSSSGSTRGGTATKTGHMDFGGVKEGGGSVAIPLGDSRVDGGVQSLPSLDSVVSHRADTYAKYGLSADVFSCVYDTAINGVNNVSVVTRCPPLYDDAEVTQMCHNVTDDDMMTRLPVSGMVTGVLYRNLFCAMCHQEPFVYWAAGVLCTSRQKMSYDQNTSLSDLPLNSTYCTPFFQSPSALYRWRPCLADVIDKCNDSFPVDTQLNRDIAARCENVSDSTQRLVYGFTHAYRNQFCALCNHDSLSFLSCDALSWESSITPDKRRTHIYSFSILLDINTNTGSTTVGRRLTYETVERNESASCDQGHVFDPFRAACRPVTCGPGRHFVGNSCIRQENNDEESDTVTDSGLPHNQTFPDLPTLPDCSYILLNHTEYQLADDGTLELVGTDTFYNISRYVIINDDVFLCVSFSQNYTNTVITQVENATLTFSLTEAVISTCGICISLLAMAVTIFVYAVLRPLRNIPGQNLLSLVCSLFLADLLLLVGPSAGAVPLACALVAGGMHYMFLAAFVWMNVMAVDVWFTFSKAFVKAGDRGKSSKRFLLYSCYAWLAPCVFVLPAVLLQVLQPDSSLSPGYGSGLCWLTNKFSLLLFFAVPLFLLLLLNVVFFLISARNISRAKRASARMLGKEEEGKMAIYVKLTVVMGLTWVLGFLAALVPGNQILTYAFVVMNTLQGLFICLSFVLTKKVMSLLKDKFCSRKKFRVTKSGSTDMTNVSKSLSGQRKASTTSAKSHTVVV